MAAQHYLDLLRPLIDDLARRPEAEVLPALRALSDGFAKAHREIKRSNEKRRRKQGPGRMNLLSKLLGFSVPGWLVAVQEEPLFKSIEAKLASAKARQVKTKLPSIALEAIGEKTINGRTNWYYADNSLPPKIREERAKSVCFRFTKRKQHRKGHAGALNKLEKELLEKCPQYFIEKPSNEAFVEAARRANQELAASVRDAESVEAIEAIIANFPFRLVGLALQNELERFKARHAITGFEVRQLGPDRVLATRADLVAAGVIRPDDGGALASSAKRAIIHKWLVKTGRISAVRGTSAPNH
jgi:hypothetical protein